VIHKADGGLAELVDFVGLGGVVHLCECCRPPSRPPTWTAGSAGSPNSANRPGYRNTWMPAMPPGDHVEHLEGDGGRPSAATGVRCSRPPRIHVL
jgi:hypothetical protein